MRLVFIFIYLVILAGCEPNNWNNPYAASKKTNTYYSAFAAALKHLDPAKSYSSNEWDVIGQIYEGPLEYHYLKRPYELQYLLAENIEFAAKQATITIKPGIKYQPHPAFARDLNNNYLYHYLKDEKIAALETPYELAEHDSREVEAADFVFQIKRLADPNVASPIYSLLSEYIVGLAELREYLLANYTEDLQYNVKILQEAEFSGAIATGKHTYVINLKKDYPQLKYWLAMPFFAPLAPEIVAFYSQDGMSECNITLDRYPVGTGPYMLLENKPVQRMVLQKNPNFHGAVYPDTGEAADLAAGFLQDAGRELPFIDKIYFSLEKESMPYWNKFLQGYYDASGIASDTFNTAIDITPGGEFALNAELAAKGIVLQESVGASTMYWAFNMLDPVIGGYTEKQRKLRQAISIAIDVNEFISIFLNGRGIAANGPIPPQIRGHVATANDLIYNVNSNEVTRKSLSEAKQLLSDAGYPDGIDPATGNALQLNFEAITSGDSAEKAIFAWLQKQFAKLSIQLVVRATNYNRFRDKMSQGTGQIFFWGWNADYPDPENFLFLFYSKNAKAKFSGENAANYMNAAFDAKFEQLRNIEDSAARDELIKAAVTILQQDMPWVWGYHPKNYKLLHSWNRAVKPNSMARNTMKYAKIDPNLRDDLRTKWNRPKVWPLFLLPLIIALLVLPAYIGYRVKMRKAFKRYKER